MFLTTKALVLREANYREADKMLTLLSEREGKISVSARGARRRGCKYAAASQQLCYGEFTLFGNRGRWSVNEAETLEQFLGLRDDLPRLALGSYIAELLDAVSDEDAPNSEVLSLGLNSLYALSRGMYPPEHIKAVFELRLMCLSGYTPFLDCCSGCGEENIEFPRFSLNGGNLHCAGCPSGSAGVSLPLCSQSLLAMRYISCAEPKKIFSFSLEGDAFERLKNVCEGYVMAQLERGFGSLDYWKSVNI
ncbi:MAG: DNA repair protein RecO [Candidatus Heteroscillospira sp.]|jgi:DNA repair protein RecO (recombination protein O)